MEELIFTAGELRAAFLAAVGTLVVTLLVNRLQNKSQRSINKQFFTYFHKVGSSGSQKSTFYCYYINPIKKKFVQAPLILTHLAVKESHFDAFYKAEYYSLDSDGNTKNYQGKGTMKGNIMELSLYDKAKGEVLFILAYLANNRDSVLFNALHLCTDSRNDTVCSNRLLHKVKTNVQEVRPEGRVITKKEIHETEGMEAVYNYLLYDMKRIKLTQFADRHFEGLKHYNDKLMRRLEIANLQKLIGTWVSFSRVYADGDLSSFRWTVTQNENKFEVLREGGEGLYKGTVKVGHDYVSFVLTQNGIIGEDFIDLVSTGKRKHLMALMDHKTIIKGLTTTIVRENSDVHPVATREIMIKLSDEPIKLKTGDQRGRPTLEDMRELFASSQLQALEVERLIQIIREFIENGNERIYANLNINKSMVEANERFFGRYYVYYIDSITDTFHRFYLNVDKNRDVEGILLVEDKSKGFREDIYAGKVSYENNQFVIIQASSSLRPVAITFKRMSESGGYLTTYNKDAAPVVSKVILKRIHEDQINLKDWARNDQKEIEDKLREGSYLVFNS